jgi:putative transposase
MKPGAARLPGVSPGSLAVNSYSRRLPVGSRRGLGAGFGIATRRPRQRDPPTAQWTAPQLMEAFPWDTAPRYLLRDRDAVYGVVFSSRVQALGIREVKAAPRAPWQNLFVERVIGSIRRECLDHSIIVSEDHLRRVLRAYLAYYNLSRPHQALDNNSPQPRDVQPPSPGRIAVIPQVGGLHHCYQRAA